jgi:hypothetical protein
MTLRACILEKGRTANGQSAIMLAAKANGDFIKVLILLG